MTMSTLNPSVSPADVGSALNAVVKEYLKRNGFEVTVAKFEEECATLKRPCPDIVANFSNQPTADDVKSEVMELFNTGNREDFFNALAANVQPNLKDAFAGDSSLEFKLHVHFAVFLIRTEKKYVFQTSVDSETAMAYFKRFLESKGATAGQSLEFMPFYVLPYVPNPLEHPSFNDIFQDTWVPALREALDAFLNRTLKQLNNSQLLEMYYGHLARNQAQQLLEDTQQKLVLEHQKLLTLQENYHKLMHVTTELLSALESSIQGDLVDLSRVTNACSRVFPELFGQVPVVKGDTLVHGDGRVDQGALVRSKTQELLLVSLDYDKLKKDLAEGTPQLKMVVLQALRWRLTRTAHGAQYHSVLNSYTANDLLGCSRGGAHKDTVISLVESPVSGVQQSTARLFNAFASLAAGRSYLSGCPDMVITLMANVKKPQLDHMTLDMLLATLQKLSLKRNLQTLMIEHGVIEWLVSILEDEDSLSDYTLEYASAFLMNLCLRTPGKLRCSRLALRTLKVLITLLGSQNQEIVPYVNGALYSLLSVPIINREAHSLGLEEMLKVVAKEASHEVQHQLEFVLKQLKSENLHEDPKPDNEAEEDEEDDDEEQDVLEEELEKSDPVITSGGELQGERLLAARYSLHSRSESKLGDKKDEVSRKVTTARNSPSVAMLSGASMESLEDSPSIKAQLTRLMSEEVISAVGDREVLPNQVARSGKPAQEATKTRGWDKLRGKSLNEYMAAFSSRPKISRTPEPDYIE